jgi:basic amino acid/polyamine antiporter, APA family
MITRSGGQYVIVRRGLGEYPGFVVGWTDWISVCGAMSLGAMVITEYLEPLVPALTGRRPAVGVILVLAFGVLLWRGIRIGDISQQILSALKAVAFGVLIGLCLVLPAPHTRPERPRRSRRE